MPDECHGVHIYNLGTDHGISSILQLVKAFAEANGIESSDIV